MLNSVSPLRYPPRQLEIAREFAKLDLPIAVASMPQTSSSAPATLAGCLALCTAELLAGVVWIHSLNTKSGVALGALTAVSELRSGRQLYATPEQALMYLGAHQIVRYLGYCSGNAGFESDSCDFDFQLGWEKALSGVLSWAAGFDMLGQAGFIMDGFSMEQLVLDNEALDMLSRIGQGMIVNDDSLALDVIKKVGPGGHFLAERHTMKHARSFWTPKVFSRKNYPQWIAGGKKTVGDIAHEKALDILANNSLTPQIPEDQAKAVEEVVRKRVEQLGGSLKGDCSL
jgi:trimethylamine--corrinoid protein Co-methyltransferase